MIILTIIQISVTLCGIRILLYLCSRNELLIVPCLRNWSGNAEIIKGLFFINIKKFIIIYLETKHMNIHKDSQYVLSP